MKKESGADFLARIKARKGRYESLADAFYRTHHDTNSLYVEVTRSGQILAFNGWDTKRGLTFEQSKLQQTEWRRESFPREQWRRELSALLAYARKTDYNLIPCFEGYEINPKGHDLERWVM